MSAVRGDALHLPLPDESVDLIITSPPYFALRSYRDEGEHYGGQIGSEATPQRFLEALCTATREMIRVLKPTGSIFVNLGDKYQQAPNREGPMKMARERAGEFNGRARRPGAQYTRPKSLMGLPWRYAIGCIDDLGLILRAEIVWSKPNGLPESVRDRVRRSHEQWFHFTKEPRYFSAVDEIREEHSPISKQVERDANKALARGEQYNTRWAEGVGVTTGQGLAIGARTLNPLGKLPGSVWSIPSEPLKVPAHLGIDHFAAFPQEWPRRLILGWSPNGICVECGEGRRPVVDSERKLLRQTDGTYGKDRHRSIGGRDGVRASTAAAITGYACACPEPTADTRPAVVLDPFGGTGTVALAARWLDRIGVSVDLSMDYCRLAKWRISQPAIKILSRTWHERQGAFL